jgi:hypothetical protein
MKQGRRIILKALNKRNRQELGLWAMRIETLELSQIKTLQNVLNVSLIIELIPDKSEHFYNSLYKMFLGIDKRGKLNYFFKVD